MAPKTRGVSSSAAGMKRKRTVKRPAREPSPSTDSSSSSSTPSASPAASTHQVDKLAGKVITTGRKVDFELLENEGLLVGRQLIEMGFEKVCSLDCPTYPSLVKEFYKNLSRGDNGLVSKVRGIGLNITGDILSRLLDLPLSGPSTFATEDRKPALLRLLNREFGAFEEVFANQLSLDLRLLHNICSRILFPKTGRFDYVSERDVFIMDAVVSGKPINLPIMIIWYMADCGSKRKSSLPYGMILTKIFQSQGVAILDSEPKKNLRHTDYYSLATIHRMGFIKSNGVWERKGLSEGRAAVGEAPGVSARHPSPAPLSPSISAPVPASAPTVVQASSSSTGFTEIQLMQIRSLLDEQSIKLKEEFEIKLKEELDYVKEELRQVKEEIFSRVDLLSFSMSCSGDSLCAKLKEILEKLQGIADGSLTYTKATNQLRRDIDFATDQIGGFIENFKKNQKDEIMELIGHIKRIVYKHV